MKKLKLFTVWGGLSALTIATAVTIPLVLNQNKKAEDFKKVYFDGKVFNSKAELLNYINSNSLEVSKAMNESIFSAKIGSEVVDFNTYSEAFTYIEKKLKSEIVYLKPDVALDQGLKTVLPTDFVVLNGQKKYLAFPKFTGNNEEHEYITVDANADESEINKIYEIAIKSYIQVHSAYEFNGIYFKSLAEIQTYIINNWQDVKSFDGSKIGSLQALFLEGNQMITFNNNATKQSLKNDPYFRKQITNYAVPYYLNNGEKIEISYQNINNIKNLYDESELDYISIENNFNKTTQVVDMDGSTPNGSFYGPYYVKSGLGMDNITDQSEWDQVSSSANLPSKKDLVDVQILKSTINYLIKANGFSSVLDLLFVTKIGTGEADEKTFAQFLKNGIDYGRVDYLEKITTAISQISKGVRSNFLDDIITLYIYSMNLMIQNKENVKDIIKTAQYFDSMMVIFDSFLSSFLAPFIVNSAVDAENYKINYFQSAFSFYQEDENGKGIHFQNDPNSYIRKLMGYIGAGEDEQNGSTTAYDAQQRNTIFNLIKATMGIHGIAMNALRQNQEIYQKWAVDYTKALVTKNVYSLTPSQRVKKLYFGTSADKNKNQLWDFSYKQSFSSSRSTEERIGIWDNVRNIKYSLKVGNQNLSKSTLENNMNDYLQNYQNKLIKSYRNKLETKINDLINYFEKGTSSLPAQPYNQQRDQEAFLINTISYIDLETADVNDTIATTWSKHQKLETMVSSVVQPLSDRITNFINFAGEIVGDFKKQFGKKAKSMMTITSTSATTAEFASIEMEMQKSSVTSKNKVKLDVEKDGMSFIAGMERSSSYEQSNAWMRINREKYQSTTTTKTTIEMWEEKIDFSGLGNSIKSDGMAKTIADYVGGWVDFGNKNLNAVFQAAVNIGMQMLLDAVPILGALFKIIDRFAYDEKQVYRYDKTEDGTEFYWDGGLVEYRWWGLSANQKYSIKNLKMIQPLEIISGYATRGYYYGNEIHETLDELKYKEANKLVNNILNGNRDVLMNATMLNKLGYKNIYWKVKVANINSMNNNDRYYQNINELVNYVADFGVSSLAQDIFKTADGLVSADPNEIQQNLIDSTLEELKNILIIRLPKTVDNKLHVEKDFTLPYPQYINEEIFYGPNKIGSNGKPIYNENNIYVSPNDIIFNPNINLEKWRNDFLDDTNSQVNMNMLEQTLESISMQDYEGTKEAVDQLIDPFLKRFTIAQLTIIFEQLIDPNNRSFEDLQAQTWTQEKHAVYYFKTAIGKTEYYLDRKVAIQNLISKDNYDLQIKRLKEDTHLYQFDDKLFNSLNQIYNFILKMQEEMYEGGAYE